MTTYSKAFTNIVSLTGNPYKLYQSDEDRKPLDIHSIGTLRITGDVPKSVTQLRIDDTSYQVSTTETRGTLEFVPDSEVVPQNVDALAEIIKNQADTLFIVTQRVRDYLECTDTSIGKLNHRVNVVVPGMITYKDGEVLIQDLRMEEPRERSISNQMNKLLKIIALIAALFVGALLHVAYQHRAAILPQAV